MIPTDESRGKRITLWVLAVGILVPGGFGFGYKLFRFIQTLRGEDEATFTIVPLANYLIMAMGFLCLMSWAIGHGMFKNIEKPKYTMLERELDLQRREAAAREGDVEWTPEGVKP